MIKVRQMNDVFWLDLEKTFLLQTLYNGITSQYPRIELQPRTSSPTPRFMSCAPTRVHPSMGPVTPVSGIRTDERRLIQILRLGLLRNPIIIIVYTLIQF